MSDTISVRLDADVEHHPATADAPVRRRLWERWHLGALLAHLALSILFTWPLVLNFLPQTDGVVTGFMREDINQNLWNLWWTRHALLGGHNPFVTNVIWYPTSVSLYYHTLAVFNGILATPLLTFFSLTTTYNLIVLLSFVMSGYGAFLLVLYICGNKWAALVGSVVFAYSAYHLATMRGLLQLISVEWVPFFLLFFLMAVFGSPWRGRSDFLNWLPTRAVPAGFFLFLVSLVDWYYTMYSLLLVGLVALYVLVRFGWSKARRGEATSSSRGVVEPYLRIAACLAVYLILVSPILIPTIRELRTTSYMLPAPDAALSHSADFLTFFEPMRSQQLWGHLFLNRDQWPFGADRYEVYFTFTALLLASAALFLTRSRQPRVGGEAADRDTEPSLPGKWFWAVCALLFFLVALGPVLQINGEQIKWLFSPNIPLVMPYKLIEGLPVFNISRSPDRFDMPLTLCLAVLSGYGLNVLMKKWRWKVTASRRGAYLSMAAIALIAIELFPFPYPQLNAQIPAWYHQLGNEPGDFSILELPAPDDLSLGALRMYFQTAHGKSIFGGYISREYPHPFLQSTPAYQELTYADGAGDIFAVDSNVWFSALEQFNTRYIVLEKSPVGESSGSPVAESAARAVIKRLLGDKATPYHVDSELEVYRVPAPEVRLPFLSVGEGWEPREVGPNGSFRWMRERSTLAVEAPTAESTFLAFRAAGLGSPKRLQIFQGDQMVFDETISALQTYRTKGPLALPAGVSTLTFSSPDGTISPSELGLGDDPRRLSFAILDARLEPVQK